MRVYYPKIAILLVAVFASACSIMSHTDPEKKIRTFISDFEKSLNGPEDKILALFSTSQSKEALLAAIHVLQNKDTLGIKCAANFSNAKILMEGKDIVVDVQAQISVDSDQGQLSDSTHLSMYLEPSKNGLVINRLAAEDFYNSYISIKGRYISITVERQDQEIHKRFYAAAKMLRTSYDTVVWATMYNHQSYFYVVNGEWNSERTGLYQMGLVNEQGKVIIPVMYSLIGTPGYAEENWIEVKKGGLVGYYSMNGDSLVEPAYDWVLPYVNDEAIALVKQSGEFGWINTAHKFQEGFPSGDAKQLLLTFAFIEKQSLSYKSVAFCEIPAPDEVGSGIYMPPAYLTENGVLKEVMSDFSTDSGDDMQGGNVESIEVTVTFTDAVIGKVGALVKVVTERYLEGRESFYQHNEVDFVNEKGNVITSTDKLYGELTFTTIDSTLLEIMSVNNHQSPDYMMGVPEDESEMDIPTYYYYRLDDNGMPNEAPSSRRYSFTEFVKLSESYTSGNFRYYDHNLNQFATRESLCDATLTDMRDEILASYGYIFPDEATTTRFKYYGWYQPRYSSVDDFKGSLTEVDAFNLDYLNKLIGPPGKKPT